MKNPYALKDKSKTEKRRYEETFKIIRKYTTERKRVLVLGAHDDTIVDEINFDEIFLVDIEFGMCIYEEETVHYFEMDVNEFITHAIELGSKFDVIIMTSLIEHLTHLEKENCLRRIKNMLNPNGIFILGYPNGRSMNRLLGVEMGLLSFPGDITEADKKVGHKHMYNPGSIKHFKRSVGLKEIERIGIMFKPLPNALMDKYFSDHSNIFIEIGKELGIESCAYILVVFKNVS